MILAGLLPILLLLPAGEAFASPLSRLQTARPMAGMMGPRSRGVAMASPSSSSAGALKPKLYAYHRSRSKIVEWLLQELNVDYDIAPIAMDLKEHKSEEFLKINAFGKLPVLEMENGEPLMESGAILMYIADKYGGLKTAEERAALNSWSHFANASLGPAIFVTELRERQMPDLFGVLDKRLREAGPYLMGSQFTAADVAVGSYLAYIPRFFPGQIKLDTWPNLKKYVDLVTQREAFKRTVGAPPPAEGQN